MKKHLLIAISILVIITIFCIAANFILWGQGGKLEQGGSPLLLPLYIGLVLEMPSFYIISLVTSSSGPGFFESNEFIWVEVSLISGILYAGLYSLFVTITKSLVRRQPPNTVA